MKALFSFLVLAVVLTACSSGPTAEQIEATVSMRLTAVATPAMTKISLPTAIPQPTNTPRPTNTPKPKPTFTLRPTQTSEPEVGTRQNPYPFGSTASMIKGEDELEFEITIEDVKRGDTAWDTIFSANQFNEKAPDGMEYILATVVVEYTGSDKGALALDVSDWAVVTSGQALDRFSVPTVCCLQSEFEDIKVFSGGKAKGVMAWPVYKEDENPMLVIGMHEDGSGGVFFSLQ